MTIETRLITDLSQLEAREWEALADACPDATVFQRPAWIRSWWSAFASPAMSVHAFAVFARGRLTGLAPLYRASGGAMATGTAELHFLGEGPSDYNQFLTWDGEPEILEALMEAVTAARVRGVAVALRDVPQFSPLALYLNARLARAPAGLRRLETTPCPRIRLTGNATGVKAILRKESLRRHYKALSALGPVTARHHRDPETIRALLPEMYRQHIDRWSDTPYPSLFLSPAARTFYELLAGSLGAEGNVILTEVRAGAQLAAVHFGLRSRGDFIWYKPTFASALKRQGPGEVLLRILIEYAQSEGYETFDFTRGEESFKSRFATSIEYNASYEWAPLSVRRSCVSAMRRLRRLAGRVLAPLRKSTRASPAKRAAQAPVLLLGPPAQMAVALRESLGRARIPSDIAGATAALEDLRRMDQERHYGLVIPFEEHWISVLRSLPADDSLRQRLLAPNSSAQPDPGPAAHANATDAAGQPLLLHCLCAQGRLSWYRLGGTGWSAAGRFAWRGPDTARRALYALGWHGFATVQLSFAGDGRATAHHIRPVLAPEAVGTDVLARFIESGLALANGGRVAPQPAEFLRVPD
jgi:CelD/BcsL family acetyltransferase involved in cellulose biosynthesis